MGVTVEDPGAGEPAGILALARGRSAKADEIADARSEAIRARNTVCGSTWTGKARDAFVAAIDAVTPELALLERGLRGQSDALRTYAGRLGPLKDAQAALEAQRRSAREALTAAQWQVSLIPSIGADAGLSLDDDARRRAVLTETVETESSRLRRLDAEWEQLVTRRRQIDAACVAALSGDGVLGRMTRFTAAAVVSTDTTALLAMLRGLSATDLAVLLEQRPVIARRIAELSPEAAATWWKSMNGDEQGVPSASQLLIITSIPGAIGNLDGVAFWARDQANRRELESILERSRRDTRVSRETVRVLKAVLTALGDDGGSPPRQLISLVLDRFPKASVSVGDLDTATTATFLVPGMNTTVEGDIEKLTKASTEFRSTQGKIDPKMAASSAVVAWIGYEPPLGIDVPAVLANDRAHAGGARLAQLINGHAFVKPSDAEVSLVAHSYGTAVACAALSSAHADHVVLLGSAGIPGEIHTARDLNVPPGEVYASQGSHDGWAAAGQLGSRRVDPTDPSFGATAFSSEAATDDNGHRLCPVTNHGPIGGGGPATYSYLDRGTASMYDSAKVTLGRGDEVHYGGLPVERILQQLHEKSDDIARLSLR
ncbi:alpha/beta hydrolase [Leifsonia poae]|uniref:DUF1023 domain-containing protein n=1 Tax=Leifsonia poae TaxID=110933 RepID=A0A9W6H9B5_9MICO|nr:alpha/beta hydrolase [Leifsonia poae]GLJ75732.1 hypothetical protein GCM10017584_13060 [Leifsonia poae]